MKELKIVFAFLYDLILLIAIWMFASIPFVLWQGGSFNEKPMILLAYQIYLIAITYAYLTHFWIQSGQTPGLRTWKLRIVREDGFLLSRHNANLRFLLAALLFSIGWIGLLTKRKQPLQDIFARTKIVAVEIETK